LALRDPITVPIGTRLAPRQRVSIVREPSRVPCKPKIASAKAMWIAKSTLASLESASHEVKIVLDYKTPFSPQLRLSHEAKTKTSCAYNEATAASLASITSLGGVKPVACEAKTRALVCDNVADLESLKC